MTYALKCQGELLDMLSMARPHLSEMEEEYIRVFIEPWSDYTDKFGNIHKTVGENPRILFSSHTDTVHRKGEYQNLDIYKHKVVTSDSTCLGADDTVGNYLMISMIQRGIEGKYIFHRGEERGGIGSGEIAKHTPEVLDGIDIAIALDRKSNDDVVQFQSGERCCSKQFASDLAKMMGMTGGDPHGTFTDTANYTALVPECTNISVAYWDQHSKHERCDIQEISRIEERLLNADWSTLKVYPFEPEYEFDMYDMYSTGYSSRYGTINHKISEPEYGKEQVVDGNDVELWKLHDLLVEEPAEVAWWLYSSGVTSSQIVQECYDNPDVSDKDDLPVWELPEKDWCEQCGYEAHPDQTCNEYYSTGSKL